MEDFSEKIEKLINELKEMLNNINESKEALKLKIANVFTKIRNATNEREDELLQEVDNIFDKTFVKDDILKNGDKIPNQIKKNIEKGKALMKEWDNDNNKLNHKIDDCIKIENSTKNIIEINENLDKCKSKNVNIKFLPEEDEQISEFLGKIKIFGNIIEGNNLKYEFNFKPGNNYNVTKNGLLATKNQDGDDWNCIIIGDKEIQKIK